MTVTAERREAMRAVADVHDEWVGDNLDTPFDPAERGEKSVYNQHHVDLDADGKAQDAYADQVAAATGNQTAAEIDVHGNWHSDRDGRFIKKGSGAARRLTNVAKALESGEPDALAPFNREQLQREVRRLNREGADIKLRRGASADEIKDALRAHAGSGDIGGERARTADDIATDLRNIQFKIDEEEERLTDLHGADARTWPRADTEEIRELRARRIALKNEAKQATGQSGAPAPARQPSLPEIRASLLALPVGERKQYLDGLGLNQTQARQLAKDLGVKGAGRSTADEAVGMVLRYFGDTSVGRNGQPGANPTDADKAQAPRYVPPHIQDALDMLGEMNGGEKRFRPYLPTSMLFGQVSKESYESHFTPEQRAQVLAKLREILPKMKEDARDRPGVVRAIGDLEAIDKAQAQANIDALMDTARVREAKLKLERGEKMHGSDRSKWPKKDQEAAAKLDKIIAGNKTADNTVADSTVARKKEAARFAEKLSQLNRSESETVALMERKSAADLRRIAEELGVRYPQAMGRDREGLAKHIARSLHAFGAGMESSADRRRQNREAEERFKAAKGELTPEQAADARARANAQAGLPLDGPTLWEIRARDDAEQHHERLRERQRKIDSQRERASLLAEIDEIVDKQQEPRVMEHRIRALMRQGGFADDPNMKPLLDADMANYPKLQELVGKIAEDLGFKRLGGEIVANVEGPFGPSDIERGRFRRGVHTPMGGSIREGQVVDIVRPGYVSNVDGEEVTLFPAVVFPSTNDPVLSERPFRRGRVEPEARAFEPSQTAEDAREKAKLTTRLNSLKREYDRVMGQLDRQRMRRGTSSRVRSTREAQLDDRVSDLESEIKRLEDQIRTPEERAEHRRIERERRLRRAGIYDQTAAAGDEDGLVLDAAFSAALEAAMELGDDATEEEFAAEFMAEFASRMPEHLQRYWTEGAGAARVRWFVRGAFRRCRRVLRSEGVPGRMLDGTCANLYHRATGRWPGAHKTQTAAVEVEDEFAALTAVELSELVDILTEEMNMGEDHGTQTACGCGGSASAAEPPAEMAADDGYVSIWEGPLAPMSTPTGDAEPRMFAPGALSGRGLPRALRWQPQQERGHDGAVVVGALTHYWLDDRGTPWGRAYFFDENVIPEAAKARYLAEHGVVAPSVDLEPSMDVAFTDEEGNQFNPMTCGADGSCPTRTRSMITRGTIASATLVPIAAFGELGSGRLYRGPQPTVDAYRSATQIAAVRFGGWDDMPIADESRPWDAAAAERRIAEWATESDEVDWERYGQAFLWRDTTADSKGSFKFPVADVIEDELVIIPRAVFAAAARVGQAGISAEDQDAIREALSDIYDQVAEELGNDDLIAPWDDDREEMSVKGCGCAAKIGAMVPDGTQTAAAGCDSCGSKYGVFGNLEPYPADAFGPVRFDQLTPVHIEQRPGEAFARVVGHVGDWKGCHRSFKHVCVPPPKSRTNYAEFHTAGHVRTHDGLLRVGKVVMGEGHPDSSVPARVARAYYDATSKEIAHVRGYEDQFGPYINGVLAPGVTPEEATTFLASPVSGDWKNHEMIAVLAVNVGGHPIRTSATFDANGMPRNVVAAGRFWPEEDDADVTEAAAVLWAAEHRQLLEVIG